MRIGVLHGPNLNLLGSRHPELYGDRSLDDIQAMICERARRDAVDVISLQSNHEGELIDWVQEHADSVDGWLVNAASLTHTSLALRDALAATGRPLVEVHLSNVLAREPFRRESLIAPLSLGVVAGFKAQSYLLGLEALVSHLSGTT